VVRSREEEEAQTAEIESRDESLEFGGGGGGRGFSTLGIGGGINYQIGKEPHLARRSIQRGPFLARFSGES